MIGIETISIKWYYLRLQISTQWFLPLIFVMHSLVQGSTLFNNRTNKLSHSRVSIFIEDGCKTIINVFYSNCLLYYHEFKVWLLSWERERDRCARKDSSSFIRYFRIKIWLDLILHTIGIYLRYWKYDALINNSAATELFMCDLDHCRSLTQILLISFNRSFKTSDRIN